METAPQSLVSGSNGISDYYFNNWSEFWLSSIELRDGNTECVCAVCPMSYTNTY